MSDKAPLRLADPGAIAVLLLTAVLCGFAWHASSGYQIADSVEYLERARIFVEAPEELGTKAIRSFAFSALFVPFFWIADFTGAQDLRWIMTVARLFTFALSLALVWRCMRIGNLLGGRVAGLAAGVAVASMPVFLRYSASPLTGIPSALCVAFGLERILEKRSAREHFIGGLWFGLAFILAYKAFLIGVVAIAVQLLRDRWHRLRAVFATLAGFLFGIGAQVVLDRVAYGEWGASVFRYLAVNVGAILTRFVWDYLGQKEWAVWIYDHYVHYLQEDGDERVEDYTTVEVGIYELDKTHWYVANIDQMLALPLLAILAVALWAVIRRPKWKLSSVLLVFGICVFVMSHKGSKNFRLWLPLVPFLAALAGAGSAYFFEAARGKLRAIGTALVVLALLVALPLGYAEFERSNPRRYHVYWEALDWVESQVSEGGTTSVDEAPRDTNHPAGARPRVVASYHWAISFRATPQIWTGKLSRNLDAWPNIQPAERDEIETELAQHDWFISHLPVLTHSPDLMRRVNELFVVAAAFHDRHGQPGLGPVFVLRRRTPLDTGDEPCFFRLEAGTPTQAAPRRGVPAQLGDESEQLVLADWRYETLPGSEHGWITYTWFTPTGFSRDLTLTDRITSPDERSVWQNNHEPAYGVLPTSTLEPGTFLRESYIVVAGQDPFSRTRPFVPLGGPYRRGTLIPVRLWISAIEFDEDGTELSRLALHDSADLLPPGKRSPNGVEISKDGLALVGRFLLPRHTIAAIGNGPEGEP